MYKHNYTNPFKTLDNQSVVKGEHYWTPYGPTGMDEVVVQENQHSDYCMNNHTDEERTTFHQQGALQHPNCGCQGFVECAYVGTIPSNSPQFADLDGTRLLKWRPE